MAQKRTSFIKVLNKENERRYLFIFILVCWSLFMVTLFLTGRQKQFEKVEEYALTHARSSFEKDVLYRNWNAFHGGVYVPVTEKLQPNPFLLDYPNRDLQTVQGQNLTIINPAWMNRFIYQAAFDKGIHIGNITSLRPLRPDNKADDWEKDALLKFEAGETEFFSQELMRNKKYFRYMKPLYAEDSCLGCHALAGYTVGDVVGGISVAVPLAEYENSVKKQIQFGVLRLLGIWGVGVIGVIIAGRIIIRREDYIKKRADEWATIFDALADCVSVHDKDYKFLRVNKAMAGFLGKNPEQLIGKKCYEEVHFLKQVHADCPLKEAFLEGKFVTKTIYDDHHDAWLEVSVTPIRDLEGKVVSFVHIARDVTEIHHARLTVEKTAVYYRQLFEYAPLAYQAVNKEGELVNVNRAWLELFGYNQEEVVGKPFNQFVKESDRDKANLLYLTLQNETEPQGIDLQMVAKNSEVSLISVFGKSTAGLKEGVELVHCILYDLSKTKEYEELLLQYSEDLSQQVREQTEDLAVAHQRLMEKEKLATIGKLAGSVAHDIRNPIGAISNSVYFIHMLIDKYPDEKLSKHIAIMKSEIARVNNILNDLMDFTLGSEQHVLPGNINLLIQEVVTSTLTRDNVDITVDFDSSIPTNRFDPTQLRRVFDNLISNAVQSIPTSGRVLISSKMCAGSVKIKIEDNGVGIDGNNFDRLFDPLFTTKTKGIGFGLSIVKSFVEAHDGEIKVESELGQGTVFTVSLPLERGKSGNEDKS